MYWLGVFDDYCGTIPLLTIAFFELIAVAWVYGLDKYVHVECVNSMMIRKDRFSKFISGRGLSLNINGKCAGNV